MFEVRRSMLDVRGASWNVNGCTTFLVVAVLATALGCQQGEPPTGSPVFVGSATCAGCHQRETELWKGSDHALAMQPADSTTVRGNFNNATFRKDGVTSTFFRREDKFFVRTDAIDGTLQDFEIKYTFGIEPLQQYLIEFPDGRLQALGIAWDARPRPQGGQRWFHLYPGQRVDHKDPLHWTGLQQNWNYMCAECHSTNVRKGYDAGARRFATTFSEVNVSCEACHGPGSAHVAWGRKEGAWPQRGAGGKGLLVALDERKDITWRMDSQMGTATRSSPRATTREIEVCARCHSRRGQISEEFVPGKPIGDTHRIALLDDGLYFSDGQMRDEVYEYGSFLQSRMYHAGVTCSDCHEPHSLKLTAAGSAVCLQCHAAERFATPAHHHHPQGSRGAQCVECHMPARTYMVVDPRRDHSFRIPRPDLSVGLKTPNACNQCHTDRSPEWAGQHTERWYGRVPQGYQRFAEVLRAGTVGAPGAHDLLLALVRDTGQPAIARATALAQLSRYASAAALDLIRTATRDQDPLIRRAAAEALERVEPRSRAEILAPLLDDPVRDVRIAAARALADVPAEQLSGERRRALTRALQEYVRTQELHADRPEAHLNLGLLRAAQGQVEAAEREYKIALELQPSFAPAAVNLADLHRATGRDEAGEAVLRHALSRSPDNAGAHHALGLLLARQKRTAEALAELQAAADLAPDNARYGYVYGVALHSAGQERRAVATLQKVLKRHPYDRDTLFALAAFHRDAGEFAQARDYARQLARLEPGSQQVDRLLRELGDSERSQ